MLRGVRARSQVRCVAAPKLSRTPLLRLPSRGFTRAHLQASPLQQDRWIYFAIKKHKLRKKLLRAAYLLAQWLVRSKHVALQI